MSVLKGIIPKEDALLLGGYPTKIFETVDAVPVVRCKDCKWKIVTMLKENYCLKYEDIVKDDYFCADAERSEDGSEEH